MDKNNASSSDDVTGVSVVFIALVVFPVAFVMLVGDAVGCVGAMVGDAVGARVVGVGVGLWVGVSSLS
jgi:hypothetical protein